MILAYLQLPIKLKRLKRKQGNSRDARKTVSDKISKLEIVAVRLSKMRNKSGEHWIEPHSKMRFQRVQGGRFMRGSPVTESGRAKSELSHPVQLEEFWMGKTEVAVGQFQKFVEESGYKADPKKRGCWWWTGTKAKRGRDKPWQNPGYFQNEEHPVTCVNWHDAIAYASGCRVSQEWSFGYPQRRSGSMRLGQEPGPLAGGAMPRTKPAHTLQSPTPPPNAKWG